MIRFYGHLLEGVPKDEALRAAQLEFIRGLIINTGPLITFERIGCPGWKSPW